MATTVCAVKSDEIHPIGVNGQNKGGERGRVILTDAFSLTKDRIPIE